MLQNDILVVNLTDGTIKRKNYAKLFDEFIGGLGVGIHLLDEYVPANVDPLSPENAIIFLRGGISGFFPIASKTVCLFRSPLTGDLGESYAGGRLSLMLLLAGIGGIVILGKADKTSYLIVDQDKAEIKRAGPLSYMYTSTIGRVLRESHPSGPGRRSILRIGPAGESLIRYSGINVDTFRHFGRLGGGTVMGSKNLKAIMVMGNQTLDLDAYVENKKNYRVLYQQIWEKCVKTPVMRKYHVLGTPENVLLLNYAKGLPTNNFQQSTFEHADEISGELFVQKYLTRRLACNTCPVGCIHIASLREQYQDSPAGESPADIHTISVSYDYELLYALGSNLGLKSPSDILKLIELTEKQGLDSITVGLILSWLAEAQEKGIISSDDTEGISIRFGEVDGFLKTVKKICYRVKNQDKESLFWYAGEGLDALTAKYGGEDFAIAINNNPPAGYSTGPYTIIGHAIGARHSHLDNAGYSLDQKSMTKEIDPEQAIISLIEEEEWRNVLNSLIICLFAKNIFIPSVVENCLTQLRIHKTVDDFLSIGRKIQKKKLEVKEKFGFDLHQTFKEFPKRFYTMPTSSGLLSEDKLRTLITKYLEISKNRYGER